MKLSHTLVAAAVALSLSAPANAMTFELTGDGETIRASGPIIQGDTQRLRAFLTDNFKVQFGGMGPLTLSLHSPGGNVLAGIELTNFVRERGLNTFIAEGNGCYSACTFVFLGGLKRTALGQYGVHAMAKGGDGIVLFTDRDLAAVQELTSTLINLALSMVGDARVIAAMLKTPNETIHVVPDKDLSAWRIITDALRPTQRMTASFDCTKQGLTPVQLTVCNSLFLSDTDRRVAAAYKWLDEHKVTAELGAEQQQWQKYLDSCRNVSGPAAAKDSCIREAYTLRMNQLEGLKSFNEASKAGPASRAWKEVTPEQDITTIGVQPGPKAE